MSIVRRILLIVLLASVAAMPMPAQNTGSLEVVGRVKIGSKTEKLKRKRFYLFAGGLAANKAWIDRLKATEFVSRDCFYCAAKASAQYIAWLNAEDCESPYCRDITKEDVAKVPEFKAAYDKGMGVKFFRGKANIAEDWLTVNLDPKLRDGFYLDRKAAIVKLLAGEIVPLQSAMTDSVTVAALFIDVPVKTSKAELYTVSNLVPIEVGGKSYIWACEVGVNANKKDKLVLKVPDGNKPVPKCEVIVRDLKTCTAGSCTP